MDRTKATLETLLGYLIPLLPLANSHTVDFIVDDTWTKLTPENIRIEVQLYGVEYILDRVRAGDECHLSEFVRIAGTHVIENCTSFRDAESLNFSNLVQPVKLSEFMTNKKLHEVECMSKVVANVAKICHTDLIVDIGSGKGYLTSILALHHRLRVLGLDCSETNINGAVRTTTKLERKWGMYENKPCKASQKIVKDVCSSHEEYYEKYRWRSSVVGDLFKSRVETVFEGTNLKAVLAEEYPDQDEHKVLLTGLHTCGNLAASCLRLFLNNENIIQSVVNVSCCYHLIDEEFINDPPWHRTTCSAPLPSFPMSTYLKERRFFLGRDARMCGTQNPSRIFKDHDIANATKPLFYRALLQKLLEKTQKPNDLPSGIVGRIAHKCKSFEEYAAKAFNRLGIQIDMDEDELNSFFHQYIDYWHKLKIFFLLKTALSPVIETVILLDRLLYLYERNIRNAFVTRLFDPVISPRCYAIIAFRRASSHLKNTKAADTNVECIVEQG